MSEKGKAVSELGDELRLWDLALVCDMSQFKRLNTKLQGQQKIVCYVFGPVRAFEMKLKLFQKALEYVNLCSFPSWELLHKDRLLSARFLCVRYAEMHYFLAENFEIRFSVLRSHATNIRDFEIPFSVEVSDGREILQLEMAEHL